MIKIIMSLNYNHQIMRESIAIIKMLIMITTKMVISNNQLL